MSWPSKIDELQKTETEFSYKSLIDSVELKSEEKDRIRSKMKGSAMTYIKHKKEVWKSFKTHLSNWRKLAKEKDKFSNQ